MNETIFSQIRQEAKDFYEQSISVVPGYSFNQYDTLKRIHLYLNSKYENGGIFLNRELLFYNIVTAPCEVATRMLNIDTKDIRLWPMNPKSHFATWLLEKELKLWLKTSKMGRILNQIAEEAPRYGTVVLEKTKDGANVVDLRRLVNDQTVDSIQDSRFVSTIHYMTPTQLRETGWDNVEEAIDKFGSPELQEAFEDEYGNLHQMQSTPYVKVVKRYGEVPSHWLGIGTPNTKKGEKLTKALFIVAGADYQQLSAEGKPVGEMGVVLFRSAWHKEWPFKDFHYTKIKGRYLGMGIVEMLFDVQVRVNELKNSKRFSMEISDLPLFQTADRSIVRNVLTDLLPGDVLQYKQSPIERVANEDRNFTAHKDEEESYMLQAQRLSFANEAVNGQPLPASTPATNALIAQQGSTSVYAFKRENLTVMLRDYFNDLVMPQLMRDLTPEHIMRFLGNAQEMEKLDRLAAEVHANDIIKQALLTGDAKNLNPETLAAAKQEAVDSYKTLGESRYIKIKKDFYKDAEFEFDFIIGNEQADPATIAQNTFQIISTLAANPAVMQDERLKLLVFKYSEALGVSPAEMEFADQQEQQKPQPQEMQPQIAAPQPSPVQTIPPLTPTKV